MITSCIVCIIYPETLQFCGRCKKHEALKRQRLKELDESDHCLAGSCTIRDMIEQSSGSGSGLPLLVCIQLVMLDVCFSHVVAWLTLSESCLSLYFCMTYQNRPMYVYMFCVICQSAQFEKCAAGL